MFSWSRTVIRRNVVVNLDTGRAFQGVLWAKRSRLVVLRQTIMLEPGTEPAPVDGEVIIERDRIEFVQVMP